MRSIFYLVMILTSFNSFSQYREVYSGISLNNYHWNASNSHWNQNQYGSGFQIGIMASPKLKFIRGIGKGLISPYASFEYANARNELASHDIMQIHAVRAALPTRIRVFSFSKKTNSCYALIEPGINFSFLQTTSSRLVVVPKINPVDFYINAGLGSTINFKKKEVKKAGFKCSGISINASKYLPISLFRSTNYSTSGVLDQFRFNVGLRFTYMEPEKKKSSFFRRLFGKD